MQFLRTECESGRDGNLLRKWVRMPMIIWIEAKSEILHDPYFPLYLGEIEVLGKR